MPGQGIPLTQQNARSYEGQKVVAVELAGRPGMEALPLLAKMPQKAGEPYSEALVEESTEVLKAQLEAGAAPAQGIEVAIRPVVEGLRILFVLEPADYFGVYQFPGALQFPYTRLLEAAQYQSREPYTAEAVATGVAGVKDFLRQEGYFLAQVEPQLQVESRLGLVNVSFQVTMGPRAHYGEASFPGLPAEKALALAGGLSSWKARVRGNAIMPGGSYSNSALQSAVQSLQSKLNGEGRLGAQVRYAGAQYDAARNRAAPRFDVEPGPEVQLHVEGAHLWPWTRRSLIPIYQESRVDAELIREGQDNLANFFSSRGYFDAVVTTTVTQESADGTRSTSASHRAASATTAPTAPSAGEGPPPRKVTIVYTIAKGSRHKVQQIAFAGNRIFAGDDLAPQVEIKTGSWLRHGSFSAPLLASSVDNLVALYQAAGYSAVQVQPKLFRPGGNLAVQFRIEEGPQDFVRSLTIEGSNVPAGLLVPQGLRLGPGTPFAQSLVAEDRAHILAYYLSRGFLNVSFRVTAERTDGTGHELAVVYQVIEGPQVQTRRIITAGRKITQQRYIDKQTAGLHKEGVLGESAMLGAESQLYAPGIFDWAEVSPRRPITMQTQEDVVVRVHEARRNVLDYGIGFEATNRGGSIPEGTVAVPGLPVVTLPNNFTTSQAWFFGPSGSVEYTRLNLGGKDETLHAGGYAGRLDQHGSIGFTNPNLFWTRLGGNLTISGEHDSQNPIYTANTGEASYQIERGLNPDLTTHLFLGYAYSVTDLSRLLIPDLVPLRDQHIHLSTLSATFVRDTRDNPLDAHRGMLESYELDYSPTVLGSSANFAKLVTQTAYYRRVSDGIVWANNLRLGAAHAFDASFVPLSQAFFSGGASTLRGFPLDGAGPQRTVAACGDPANPATCSKINVPAGGDLLAIINSELRIPLTRVRSGLGMVLFYDGGNVFGSVSLASVRASYTNTVGLGLRYATPVGPIRIDVGHNLNPISGIQSSQIFFSIGQAF